MTVETCPWVNLKSHTVVKKREKMQKWQKKALCDMAAYFNKWSHVEQREDYDPYIEPGAFG